MKETQKTVYDWAVDTFPSEDTQRGRVIHVVEEAVELGYAAGLELHDLQTILVVVLAKCRMQRTVNDREEAADLLACLFAYAEQQQFDVLDAMNNKMELNRSRPQSYYDAKTSKKKALGMPT